MKYKEITRENLEEWFNHVFDYEVRGGEFIQFKTDEGTDGEFYEVLFGEDFVELPNGGNFGGGYIKDKETCEEAGVEVLKIETSEDVYDAVIVGACNEEKGWVCY